VRDWKCFACGTVWRPSYPKWQACAIALTGLALLTLTGLALLVGLAELSSGREEHFTRPVLAMIAAFVAGSAAVAWRGLRLAFGESGRMAIVEQGTDWSGKHSRLAEEPGEAGQPRPSRRDAPMETPPGE